MTGTRRILITATLAAMLLMLSAPVSQAAHHLVKIRQVFPGYAADPEAEFVVLQLTGQSENNLHDPFGPGSSATVRLYSNMGVETNSQTFTTDPPNGENQRTVLVGTADAAAAFGGVALDLQFTTSLNALSNLGGAACLTSGAFGGVDCVGWGSLTFASPPSPIGTLEAAVPTDEMLQRTIAATCPSFFETGDDTDNSNANFFPVSPPTTPRNNAAAIVEVACNTLNVLKAGTGTGTVTGNGSPAINCGSTCSALFPPTDTATLTATPAVGSTFTGWTNCPTPAGTSCDALMNTNRTITANFTGPPGGGSGTPAVPSGAFTLGGVKGKTLTLNVTSAGTAQVIDAAASAGGAGATAAATRLLKASTASGGPGTITVPLKLNKKGKAKLNLKGKVTVNARITFTPNGGTATTQTQKLKIKK
jgi:hypothetical protein